MVEVKKWKNLDLVNRHQKAETMSALTAIVSAVEVCILKKDKDFQQLNTAEVTTAKRTNLTKFCYKKYDDKLSSYFYLLSSNISM